MADPSRPGDARSTVLLVDTGFSSAPLLDHLVGGGAAVQVVGARPDDALARAGVARLEVDYSDVGALVGACTDTGARHLVPGCNDVSLLACAEAAAATGIAGHDDPAALRRLLDKRAFRELCAELGLAAPRLLDAEQAVGRAVVVKPARSYSGHGITVLDRATPSSLATAIAAARAVCAVDEHLVEERAVGRLHSHSAFLVDGRIVADFWVREEGASDPLAVDVSTLARPDDRVVAAVRDEVHTVAEELGLADGLVHTQLLVDGRRHALIEVTRRCPGDLYAELVRRSTGYDYAAAYCAAFTGRRPPAHTPTGRPRPVLRTTVSTVAPTVLGAIELPAGLPVGALVPVARAGDPLGTGPAGRAAVLFLDCDTPDELAHWWDRAVGGRLHVPRRAVADS